MSLCHDERDDAMRMPLNAAYVQRERDDWEQIQRGNAAMAFMAKLPMAPCSVCGTESKMAAILESGRCFSCVSARSKEAR